MILTEDQFGKLFDDCQWSAWRFECQPVYTMRREQDGIARWRAGEPKPEGHNSSWHETVREVVGSGRRIGRVRLVRCPLTEYQRYQLDWGIPGNIEAGEDVRILDVTEFCPDLPAHDFWIFDDSLVVDLNFHQDGTLHTVEQRKNPDLSQYRQWRATALANAVSLNEWNVRT